MYEDAVECGLVPGFLFEAYGSSQLNIEQISIDDKVNAIDYPNPMCNDHPEFRNYLAYRFTLTFDSGPLSDPGCSVNGSTAPSDPNDPPACIGAIDVKFSSTQETVQVSEYSKDKVAIFTDEGGIIGAVMFVTWFFSIITQ